MARFFSRFEFAWRHLRRDAPAAISVAMGRLEKRLWSDRPGMHASSAPPGLEGLRADPRTGMPCPTAFLEQAAHIDTDTALGRPCLAVALSQAVGSIELAPERPCQAVAVGQEAEAVLETGAEECEDKMLKLEGLVKQCSKDLADMTIAFRALEEKIVKSATDTALERPCSAPRRVLMAHLSEESTAAPSTICSMSQPGEGRIKRPGRRARAREHRERFEECRETLGREAGHGCGSQEICISTAALCSLLEAEGDDWDTSKQQSNSASETESSGVGTPTAASTRSPAANQRQHQQATAPLDSEATSDSTGEVESEMEPLPKKCRGKTVGNRPRGVVPTRAKWKPRASSRDAKRLADITSRRPTRAQLMPASGQQPAHREQTELMELSIRDREKCIQYSQEEQTDFMLELISCTIELLQRITTARGAWGLDVWRMCTHLKENNNMLAVSGGRPFLTVIMETKRVNEQMTSWASCIMDHGYEQQCSEEDLRLQERMRKLVGPWQRIQVALLKSSEWASGNPKTEEEVADIHLLLAEPVVESEKKGRFTSTSDAEIQAMLQNRLAASRRP